MSTALSVALGSASLGVIALLVARWDQTLKICRRPSDLAYLAATLVFLAVSIVAGALAVGSPGPSPLIGCLQCAGLVWGMCFVVGPLLVDVGGAAARMIGEGPVLVMAGGAAIAFCLGSLAFAVTQIPLWLWPPLLVATAVKPRIETRFRIAAWHSSMGRPGL